MSDYSKLIVPGVKVRLSGKFLASTGQRTGVAGLDRWTVQACDCDQCTKRDRVNVGERLAGEYLASMYTPEEVAAEPALAWRHIAKAALSVVGKPTSRDCV